MLLIVLMLAILTYFFGTEYRSLEMDYDRNDSLGGPSLIPHSEYRITYILTKRMCTLILTHAMQCKYPSSNTASASQVLLVQCHVAGIDCPQSSCSSLP